MKKMESVFYNGDIDSQASSTRSVTSVVSVLTAFSEINSVPLYKYLQITFVVVIGICTATCAVSYVISNHSWDNTTPDNNPVWDISSFLALREQCIKTFNYQLDYT